MSQANSLGRLPFWVWMVSTTTAVTYGALLLPSNWLQFLAGREMVFETFGSAFFLLASILFWRAFAATDPDSTHSGWRRVAYACLGVLLFVACGEELSWGQHLLGFETPEAMKELNAQQEMNLHNLWWVDSFDPDGGKKAGWRALINSNRLFDYFMITLLWLIPWANALVPQLKAWIERFGGPVVHRSLGIPLALTFGASVIAELALVDGLLEHLAVSEIRELSYALMCALAAWYLWRFEAEGRTAES